MVRKSNPACLGPFCFKGTDNIRTPPSRSHLILISSQRLHHQTPLAYVFVDSISNIGTFGGTLPGHSKQLTSSKSPSQGGKFNKNTVKTLFSVA